MSVDMSGAAISARLRQASLLADLRTENRLHGKVDMSPPAISRRLREVEQLRRLCLDLAALRPIDVK
jgi:hypothetical protein